MLMNVIGESVKFFGKKVYLRKLYKSSRSYENRINKHVVISLTFPYLIASLLSFFFIIIIIFLIPPQFSLQHKWQLFEISALLKLASVPFDS